MTEYLVAGAIALGAVGAWKVQDWRYGEKERERLEKVHAAFRQAERRVDRAAVALEGDKRQLETKYVVITEEVERVVKEPFYADGAQCLDDSGLRQLEAAIRPGAAASQPAGTVPGPAGAGERQPR